MKKEIILAFSLGTLVAACTALIPVPQEWRTRAVAQEYCITQLASKVGDKYVGDPHRGVFYYHLLKAAGSLLTQVEMRHDSDYTEQDLRLIESLTSRVSRGLENNEVPYVE